MNDASRSQCGASDFVVPVAEAELDRSHHALPLSEAAGSTYKLSKRGGARGADGWVLVRREFQAGVERLRFVFGELHPLRDRGRQRLVLGHCASNAIGTDDDATVPEYGVRAGHLVFFGAVRVGGSA